MRLLKMLEGVVRVQLMQHMAIDVDQVAAIARAAPADASSQILSNRVCGMNGAFEGADHFGRLSA